MATFVVGQFLLPLLLVLIWLCTPPPSAPSAPLCAAIAAHSSIHSRMAVCTAAAAAALLGAGTTYNNLHYRMLARTTAAAALAMSCALKQAVGSIVA